MAKSAPRYHQLVRDAIRALDDDAVPIAETWRRVATVAETAGLVRPSYVHLRRIVRAERDRVEEEQRRRAAVRAILTDAATDLALGRRIDPWAVEERVSDARGA